MAECTSEIWTLKDVYEALSKDQNNNRNRKIVVPMFQRGLRWNSEKEKTFIDSLLKNYPIGTLLFYKTVYESQEIYTLIDGLQRGNTIKKYLSNPTAFFGEEKIPDYVIEKINELNNSAGNKLIQETMIKNIISEYIKSIKNLEDLEWYDAGEKIWNQFAVFNTNDKRRDLQLILKPFLSDYKKDYMQLSNTQIPVIVYSGEESTLHEIFERINSKGVPLTQYEIYAASWPSKKIHINNDKIIEKVLKKYDSLNDAEYIIDKYNRNDIRLNKNVTAFEYIFGLSKFLSNEYGILKFNTNQEDDEINQMAFELINACFFESHKQIKDVHEIITKFKHDISLLENALIFSINFVNNNISVITKFKGNKRNKENLLHPLWLVMSLISFVFRERYDLETLLIKDTWKDTKSKISNNIWKYYVYDILIDYWSEGGTGKIHSANKEKRYLSSLSCTQLSNAIDAYYDKTKMRRESKNIANPHAEDYVILNTIYLNLFDAMDQLSVNNFDVEHIAPKDQMKKLLQITNNADGLPLSCIANLCYLPESANRSKGSKNFYQDKKYLTTSRLTISSIEAKYSFTEERDIDWMDLEYRNNDFGTLKEFYICFLDVRYIKIKKLFLNGLGFNEQQIDKNIGNELEVDIPTSALFDESFYRLERIGNLARKSITHLLVNNKLTEEEVMNLQRRDYSLRNLGVAFPTLVINENDTIDENGRLRYYKEPVIFGNNKFYLCSQWFEHDRKLLIKWIKERL